MELSKREQRAIMLETQTPAYARTADDRRAIDDLYKQARTLERITGMRHNVRAVIPHQNKYVSGLNVLSNFEIVIEGPKNPLYKSKTDFQRVQRKACEALEARNA